MTIVQYQVHQMVKQCAMGRLTIAKGHLQAILHGYQGSFEEWAGRVDAYRLGAMTEQASAKRI